MLGRIFSAVAEFQTTPQEEGSLSSWFIRQEERAGRAEKPERGCADSLAATFPLIPSRCPACTMPLHTLTEASLCPSANPAGKPSEPHPGMHCANLNPFELTAT